MDLYIRKNYQPNFEKDISSFVWVTLSIDDNDIYLLNFTDYFTYDGLIPGNEYMIKIYYNPFSFTGTTYIKDPDTTILDTVIINEYDNPIEYVFTAKTSTIKIDNGSGSGDFSINNIKIYDNLDYEYVYTDGDYNIVYNLNNLKDFKSIIMPYSKSFNIPKNEFNKKLFIQLTSSKNYRYDCIVKKDGYRVIEGEIMFNSIDPDFYEATISSKNVLELPDINVSEYVTDTITYSYDDYNNFINVPSTEYPKYKYYLSKEMDTGNFLNATSKGDFTKVNGTFLDGTTKWNWNSYMRVGVSYKYLFDLAHKLTNFNYELDDSVDLYNLIFVNDFYKEYTETNSSYLTYEVQNWTSYTMSTTTPWTRSWDISFKTASDSNNYFIVSESIVDFTLSNITFTVSESLADSGDYVRYTTSYMYLYTRDSSGNRDLLLYTHSFNFGIINHGDSDSTIFPSTNIDYHYSEYGYIIYMVLNGLSVSIGNESPGIEESYTISTSNVTIDNSYKIYAEGSEIPMSELLPTDLTFTDVIKNVVNMYNLYTFVDFETNTIVYKSFLNTLDGNTLNLSDKYDINEYKKELDGFNKKIKYTYNDTIDSSLDYDYVLYNNISEGNTQELAVNANIMFENYHTANNDFRYNDFVYFMTSSFTNEFDIFLNQTTFNQYGLGFVDVIPTTGLGIMVDWSLNPVDTKIATISSINNDDDYGLWFNKALFGGSSYKWEAYDTGIDSLYTKFYSKYDEAVYGLNPEKFKADFYLTNQDIVQILNVNYVILDNQRYIVDNMTISNNKTNLELIRYLGDTIVQYIEIIPTTLIIPYYEAEEETLGGLSASDDWELLEYPYWITWVTDSTTPGTNIQIEYSCNQNTGAERSGDIVFGLINYPTHTTTINVTQEYLPKIVITPATDTTGYTSGEYEFELVANTDWEIYNYPSRITWNTPLSGTSGTYDLNFDYPENTGLTNIVDTIYGRLKDYTTIADNISLTQTYLTPSISFSEFGVEIDYSARTDYTLGIITSNRDWEQTTEPTWISKIAPVFGSATTGTTIVCDIAENTGTTTRNGDVFFRCTDYTTYTDSVEVIQGGAPLTDWITLTVSSVTYTQSETILNTNYYTELDASGPWTSAVHLNGELIITSPSSGSGATYQIESGPKFINSGPTTLYSTFRFTLTSTGDYVDYEITHIY